MPGMTDEKLVKLAATKIMGWRNPKGCDGWYIGDELAAAGDWWPVTRWSAAGEIVDKMRADGWEWTVISGDACFARHDGFANYDDPCFPRAATIAALLALGAIQEDDL